MPRQGDCGARCCSGRQQVGMARSTRSCLPGVVRRLSMGTSAQSKRVGLTALILHPFLVGPVVCLGRPASTTGRLAACSHRRSCSGVRVGSSRGSNWTCSRHVPDLPFQSCLFADCSVCNLLAECRSIDDKQLTSCATAQATGARHGVLSCTGLIASANISLHDAGKRWPLITADGVWRSWRGFRMPGDWPIASNGPVPSQAGAVFSIPAV
ncbi:hypothetical protein EJ04DRAFT_360105 [Polyplosphaeria fusca]|uniref:Uncharacterized protein n=1 Tax=Polyplosphaeria fusca TaxID=682080 RepID=A0A9P4V0D2_9PLEO|nr:hypothetical protein EJ04DRAFT_360105 [Polyplosphaeria fusca]